jgi:hypothetical protein
LQLYILGLQHFYFIHTVSLQTEKWSKGQIQTLDNTGKDTLSKKRCKIEKDIGHEIGTKLKRIYNTYRWLDAGKRALSLIAAGNLIYMALCKTIWQHLLKLKISMPLDSHPF